MKIKKRPHCWNNEIKKIHSNEISNVTLSLVQISYHQSFCLNLVNITHVFQGPSWPWSYGNWIYTYVCNQYVSPLTRLVRILTRAWCTTLCDKVCQLPAIGQWFSPGPPVSSNIKLTATILPKYSWKWHWTNKQTNEAIRSYSKWKKNIQGFSGKGITNN
jgi:hypothetical protein